MCSTKRSCVLRNICTPTSMESEPERTQGLRQMLVDNYSVFYIVGEDAVSVARVLYSASDLVRRLRRMK